MINRREFVGRIAGAAGALALGSAVEAEAAQRPRKPTDRVRLGRTALRSSILGVGTGTIGSNHQSNQTRLGQEAFTAVIRHAFDSGVNLFDCADQYGSHTFLREALRGVPREKYVVQTKTNSRTAEGARADLDRFRAELGVEVIDIVLMHCLTEGDWNVRFRPVMDVLEEARRKGILRAHGVSCHSFEALETAAAEPWVQVDLARLNPWGKIMDTRHDEPEARTPEAVVPVLKRMKGAGKGVIAMKILAEGRMVRGDDRLERARESIRFALASGAMHAMVIGFESVGQVSEVLEQTRVAMAEVDGRVASGPR
ncbi:MAG: aldo/keto reductase [Chthonomonadales bacterium]|nr:aldo/keto reductase [Chthonomonadales bacterium]